MLLLAVGWSACGSGPTSPGPNDDEGDGERTVYLTEDFESADVQSRGWFDNTTFTLSEDEHVSGARSLEWRFEAGATLPEFGGAARILFQETESVHLSYWVRYSDNWIGSGESFHPHEFYFLTTADGRWIGPAVSHLTLYVEHSYDDGGLRPAVGMQDAENIDDERIGVDLTEVTEARAVSGCNGSPDAHPTDCYQAGDGYRNGKFWRLSRHLSDAPGERYKGDWHHIEAYFELNSIVDGRGRADGIVRYWIDEELLLDLDDVLFRTAVHPDMAIRELLLGPYIGPGSPVDQTVWIDDLEVANRR